jgi:hypothetical protein
MQHLLSLLSVLASRFFLSRRDLLLENLALRQQLAVLKVRHPQPRFAASDKLFWVMIRRLWPGWKQALILVQPEIVVGWHQLDSSCIGRGSRGIALVREEGV